MGRIRDRLGRAVRLATAAVVGVGTFTALGGPAHAYDRGNCERLFGVANVPDVDLVRVDTGTAGKVDFGDALHLGGVPQGTAAVCWAGNGDVAVMGRLFADSSAVVCVSTQITYFSGTSFHDQWHSICGNYAGSAVVSEHFDILDYDRVRIRLYNGNEWIKTVNAYRGD